MKRMINNFKEWSELTLNEKNQQINDYWINNKVDEKLKKEIIQEFLNRIPKYKKMIKKIGFEWSGWYSPTICVEIRKQDKIRLPQLFDIFEIKKSYK